MRSLHLASLLLPLAGPCFAQVDCDNATNQQQMNLCEAEAYKAADAELNATWTEARAAAKQLDAELPEDQQGAADALLAAQRAWITYRDKVCELAGFGARGGTMEPMLVSGCLRELTKTRTKELRRFIEGP